MYGSRAIRVSDNAILLIMGVISAHIDYNSWFLVSTLVAPLQPIVCGLLDHSNAMIAGFISWEQIVYHK